MIRKRQRDNQRPVMIRKVAAFALLGLASFSGHATYLHYVTHRACFNAQGRCFDAKTGAVFLEQPGPIWAWMAALSLGAAITLLLKPGKRKKRPQP